MRHLLRALILVPLLMLGLGPPSRSNAADPSPRLALGLQSVSLDVGENHGPGSSRLEAMAKSLLIPGWGQKATGHTGRAQVFFGAELGIWTAFTVFQVQGRLRRESYVELAEVLGGVQRAGGGDDDYYRSLGRFMSTDEFMTDVRRDARARFGDDLDARRAYEAENAVPPERQWRWKSEADQLRYKGKRSDSNGAFQKGRFMIAAAALNRLISVMDAARSADSSEKVAIHVRPDPDDGGPLQLCLAFPIP